LAPQTPFHLSHEVFGEAQGMESLLQGLGGLLCLAAVTLEALLGFEVATLSGFRVFFCISFGWRHGGTPLHRVDRVWTV
jgi:hypothetical protein